MTRPFGKSPSRSKTTRSQLQLEQISLIDVCAEDDSLLPLGGKAASQGSFAHVPHACPVAASPFKASGAKTLASIQEDQPECEEMPGSDEAEKQYMLPPLATQEPALRKKKKKTGFNLRKSLAWNNAFFTEEGVLDPEELSLVNKTFKKPPEASKPVSHKKPALASKLSLKPSVIPKIKFSPIQAQKSVMHVDSRQNGSALCSPLSSTGSIMGSASKRAELHNHDVKGVAGSRYGGVIPSSRVQADPIKQEKTMFSICTEYHQPKPSPLKKRIQNNLKNITGSPLPACSSPKPTPEQLRNVQSLSSTISSASKKMRDRLGMVFSGRSVGNLKGGTISMPEDGSVVPKHSVPHPDYSENAKLNHCYSHSFYERSGRSTFTASTESVTSNLNLSSESTAMKSRSSESTAMKSRSSNLPGRMVGKASLLSHGDGYSSNRGSLEATINPHHGKEQAPPALFFSHSQGIPCSSRPLHQSASVEIKPDAKETRKSGSLLSKAKPSGLRMPSPKLGFFDKARTMNAPQVAILRERTNGLAYDGVALQSGKNIGASRFPSEGVGLTSIRKQSNGFGVALQSGRSTSRPLTESGSLNDHSKQTSLLKPPKSSHQLSEATGRSRVANVPSGIPSAPHLRYTQSSSRPASLTHGSSSMPHGPSSMNHGSSSKNHGLSSNSSMTHESSSNSSHCKADITVGSTGHVLQVEKNEQNLLPVVKKMVTQLISSPSRNVSGQENLLLEHQQDKGGSFNSPVVMEKICSNEASEGAYATETAEVSGFPGLVVTHGSSSNSSHCKAGSTVGRTGNVLQVKTNEQNVLPVVKNMVTQLTSSPSRNVSGQENLLLERQQDKEGSFDSPVVMEKICSNEASEGAYATETDEVSSFSGLVVPHGSSSNSSHCKADSTVGSTGHVLQVKKNEQNVLPVVKKMVTQLTSSPSQNASGQENLLSERQQDKEGSFDSPVVMEKICSNEASEGAYATETDEASSFPGLVVPHGSSSNSSHCKADSTVGSTGHVLQVKKNEQNVLPVVKKLVTQLTSSPSRNVPGQENLPLACQQDKGGSFDSPMVMEKICNNEASEGAHATGTAEEWPQVKSGTVQHSPPNKEPPKHGPWSPVRRNAQDLGPFDCTKYTNTGIPH